MLTLIIFSLTFLFKRQIEEEEELLVAKVNLYKIFQFTLYLWSIYLYHIILCINILVLSREGLKILL